MLGECRYLQVMHMVEFQVQAEKDEDILAEEELIKPEKPQPLSDKDLRLNILAKYDKIRRKPGMFRWV